MKSEFGDVRSLVQAPPSPAAWTRLCEALERAPAGELEDELLPYVLDHLKAWPDELRAMPERWTIRLMLGEELALGCVARTMHITAQNPGELRAVVGSTHLAQLTDLKVTVRAATNRALRQMSRAALPGLRRLDLSHNLLGDRSARALSRASWLPGITALDLGTNRLTYEGLRTLTRADLHLHHLNLSHNRLGARAAHLIARHSGFTSLESLGLDGCELTPDARDALRTSATLSPTIREQF